jgi:hypothetical protein
MIDTTNHPLYDVRSHVTISDTAEKCSALCDIPDATTDNSLLDSRENKRELRKEYSNFSSWWQEQSIIRDDDAETTTTASSTTQKQTKPELTTTAWFRHGSLPEVRISFEEKDYVDDVKKRILCDGSFWFCSMRGRSDLRIFTEEGVEIGAMEKFHPYSHKDRVFVIKLVR